MNIYLISQNVNNDYDTYDSAVVIAKDEYVAREMHPGGGNLSDFNKYTWATSEDIVVEFIGKAKDNTPQVICASSNAG